jgi:hypothetical protein
MGRAVDRTQRRDGPASSRRRSPAAHPPCPWLTRGLCTWLAHAARRRPGVRHAGAAVLHRRGLQRRRLHTRGQPAGCGLACPRQHLPAVTAAAAAATRLEAPCRTGLLQGALRHPHALPAGGGRARCARFSGWVAVALGSASPLAASAALLAVPRAWARLFTPDTAIIDLGESIRHLQPHACLHAAAWYCGCCSTRQAGVC